VSIPYQSVLGEDEVGLSGAFFRALRLDPGSFAGALLLIDSRGEPLEFTYNKASIKNRVLWRERDLQRAVVRELLTTLLDSCPREPSALFFLAREVEPELFLEDIDISRPVARVVSDDDLVGAAAIETAEELGAAHGVQLLWVRGLPSDATPAHRLAERLAARGLLLEPFDRVLAGLREAYEIGAPDQADEPS
jgi:hypothetical protein